MWRSSVRSSRRTRTKHGDPGGCDPHDPTTWTQPSSDRVVSRRGRSAKRWTRRFCGRPTTGVPGRRDGCRSPGPAPFPSGSRTPDEWGGGGRHVEDRVADPTRATGWACAPARGPIPTAILISDVGRGAAQTPGPDGLSPGHRCACRPRTPPPCAVLFAFATTAERATRDRPVATLSGRPGTAPRATRSSSDRAGDAGERGHGCGRSLRSAQWTGRHGVARRRPPNGRHDTE
jgi:hypothetical protein